MAKQVQGELEELLLSVPNIPADEVPLADVSVLDLALAFHEIMKDIGDSRPEEIHYDDVPIETHMEEIVTRLTAIKLLPFQELFSAATDRPSSSLRSFSEGGKLAEGRGVAGFPLRLLVVFLLPSRPHRPRAGGETDLGIRSLPPQDLPQ